MELFVANNYFGRKWNIYKHTQLKQMIDAGLHFRRGFVFFETSDPLKEWGRSVSDRIAKKQETHKHIIYRDAS